MRTVMAWNELWQKKREYLIRGEWVIESILRSGKMLVLGPSKVKSKSSHDQDLEKKTDGNTNMIKAQAMAMPS